MYCFFIGTGSPIVNLNFCHKYAMLCSLDGTLRLVDMDTGKAKLPVISLSTAAVQCAFVSIICSKYFV